MRYHNKQYCKCCVGLCYECASCVATHTRRRTNSLAKESRSHGDTNVRNRIPPPNGNSCPGHTHNKLFANRRQKFEPATKRYVPARLTAGLKYHFSSSQLKFCIKGLANPDLKTTRTLVPIMLPYIAMHLKSSCLPGLC